MFLAPGYLWLLILAGPLLWRHLSRQTLVFKVSSITFWRTSYEGRTEHRRPSILNFQLLAELLVLLLTVFAASQITGDSGNRVAAVVFDNSPSMRLKNVYGNDRLTMSDTTATRSLGSLPESLHVGLFLAGFGKEPLVQGFPLFVSDVFAQWRPYTETASLSQTLHYSIDWLSTKDHSAKALYYFGDEAISHWPSVPEGTEFVPVTNTGFAPNYAVLGLTAKRHLYSHDKIEVKAQLGYTGVQQVASVKWRLSIGGKVDRRGAEHQDHHVVRTLHGSSEIGLVAERQDYYVSNLQNGRSAMITISVPVHPDAQTVTLELEVDDSCSVDNKYQAEIETEPVVKVFVSEDNHALRRAINAIHGAQLVEFNKRESAQVWISTEETSARPVLQFSDENRASFKFDGRIIFQKNHAILEGVDLLSSDLVFFESLAVGEASEALAGTDAFTFLAVDRKGQRIRAGFDPVSSGFIDQPGFPIFVMNALRWLTDGLETDVDIAEKVAVLDPIRTPLREHRSATIGSKPSNLPLWAFSAGFALVLALVLWRRS